MNFLQMAQEVAKLGDVSGVPTSVSSVRGEPKRIVDWVAQAWNEIQASKQDWTFLWAELSPVAMIAGQSKYARALDCRSIITNSLKVVDGAEYFLAYKPFNEFRMTYSGRADTGRPTTWTLRPDNQIEFFPIPDAAYQYRYDYYKQPVTLVDSADVPNMPDRHHMAIVYLALEKYGEFEEAPNVIGTAQQNYERHYLWMCNELLPTFSLGGALL